MNLMVTFLASALNGEYRFRANLIPKNQNYLYKLKFGTEYISIHAFLYKQQLSLSVA